MIELVKKNEQFPVLESDYASDSEDVSHTLFRINSMGFREIKVEQHIPSRNVATSYPAVFQSPIIQCNMELTTAVRKELAMALRDLMQHGLIEVSSSTAHLWIVMPNLWNKMHTKHTTLQCLTGNIIWKLVCVAAPASCKHLSES